MNNDLACCAQPAALCVIMALASCRDAGARALQMHFTRAVDAQCPPGLVHVSPLNPTHIVALYIMSAVAEHSVRSTGTDW